MVPDPFQDVGRRLRLRFLGSMRGDGEVRASLAVRPFADLRLNQPIHPQQVQIIREALGAKAGFSDAASLQAALRRWFARELANGSAPPDTSRIVIGGSAKQLLLATLATLAPRGASIAADALTYPRLRTIATELGLACVPIADDGGSLCLQRLSDAALTHAVRVLYVQPTLQNPLGVTMAAERRRELAAVLARHDIIAIEDQVLAFLHPRPPPPLAHFAPGRTVVIDSLSKRLSPALNLGFAAAPSAELAEAISMALESRGWSPGEDQLASPARLVASGRQDEIVALKRADARARNQLARRILPQSRIEASPFAYHIWLTQSGHSAAAAFVTAAAARGVCVSTGEDFTFDPGNGPAGVRIAIGSVPPSVLRRALAILADLCQPQTAGKERNRSPFERGR
jgi:DNA-binding transcriptional MocR family regulator